ncbi:MAG: TonB-dependent receptor [Woeseiaceae bacterium]|nr:TonB-dependent receptor [Woeseiaceae bacterium]
MNDNAFKKNVLASSVAMALGLTAAPITLAQEADGADEVIEEIITTGYRSSLMQSMDRKRAAKGVTDAITAEDIGKFPDQNLAESLSRITGVSINRSNNEGSQITVRGMGPEFNLVTLNGRQMPTAGSRSFDFSDLATEGVSAVEIYKTAKAGLPTGGIGATVNIITAKPLENPGLQAVIGAKMVHETSASNSDIVGLDEYTPEIYGLYSNTFAGDTIGVRISASYQERDNREENAAVDSWGQNLQLNGGNINNNNQRADGVWWHPQNVGYALGEVSRDRINGQIALQYAPTDTFTATLDYTYSEVETDRDGTSFGIWFECPNIDATINERGTVTEVTQSCGDLAINVNRDRNLKENASIGLNLDWQATDSLAFTLDMHDSSSETRGRGPIPGEPGTSANVIIGNTNCPWCPGNGPEWGPATAGIDLQTAFYGASGIPTFDVSFNGGDGNPQDGLLRSDIGSLFGQAFDGTSDNDILQVQLGGSWENMDDGAVRRINFGISHTYQDFINTSKESGLLPAGFWLTSAQYWPEDVWQEASFDGLLSAFSNGGSYSYSDYFTAPFDYLVNRWEEIGGTDPISDVYWPGWGEDFQDPSGTRGRFWSGPLDSGGISIVDEKVEAAYVSVDFEDEFNGMPFGAVLGFRYEKAETRGTGFEIPATAVVWVGGNEFAYETGPRSPASGEGSNTFFLPNLDLDLEVHPDMVARFSYSRSIARPPIGALIPTRSFPGNPNIRSRRVSAGNPNLEPYVSDNLDFSFEWYYDEGSYVSVGHFRKQVDNFLVDRITEVTFEGITDPYVGALAEQARADLADEGIPADDQAVFRRINENRGTPITDPVRAAADDPLVVFDQTRTENEEVGNLFGIELAVQHMFGDSGWGLQANYTDVNGDVDADRDVINQSFALPGLSDSANLSVFYENDLISARIAYNWRDEFLTGFDGDGSPVFTEEYAPIDANFTYFASDQLTVFFEIINLTDETTRTFVRYEEQFLSGSEFGTRYNIGARYDFQ